MLFAKMTIVSEGLANKISNWKVDNEVFLNTDHKMVSFKLEDIESFGETIKWDFVKAD